MEDVGELGERTEVLAAATVFVGEDTACFAVFLLEEEAKVEVGGRLPEHAHLEFSGKGESCGFALGAEGDFAFECYCHSG